MSFVTAAGLQTHEDHISDWNAKWWINRQIAVGRYVYFIDRDYSKNITNIVTEQSFGNITVLVLGAIGFLYRHLFGCFNEMYFGSLILSLWISAKSFANLLNFGPLKSEYVGWNTIYAHYLTVQRLSRLVNEFIGSQVVWLILNHMFYFATHIDELLIEAGVHGIENIEWHRVIRLVYFTAIISIVLWFSADVCHQVIFPIFVLCVNEIK